MQAVATGITEYEEWNPWSQTNSELLRKRTDAHKLLVTFTGASPNLHVIAGQIFYELLGAGVSSSGLQLQENEASTSHSNIKMVPSAALLQPAGALMDTTG